MPVRFLLCAGLAAIVFSWFAAPSPFPTHAQPADDFPLVATLSSNRRSVIAFDQIWWTVTLTNTTPHAVEGVTVAMLFDERVTHFRFPDPPPTGTVVIAPPRFALEGLTVPAGETVDVWFDVEVRGRADTPPRDPFTHTASIIYADGRVQHTNAVSVRLDAIPRTTVRWWWGLAVTGLGLLVAWAVMRGFSAQAHSP